MKLLIAAGLFAAVGLPALIASTAQAATLSQVEVRFDRMQAAAKSSGMVCAKPATTGGQTTVVVGFPTGFTVSTTNSDWATDVTATASWPTGAVAWPSIGAQSTTASGQNVTWASGSLTSGTLYCFNWTNTTTALTIGAAGNYTGTVTTGSDSATYSTTTIANDQITVSATVPQAFTFSLSGNTDSLGTLSTGSIGVSPTPRFASIDTNAANGWQVWAKDASTGVHSTAASYTIASGKSGGSGAGVSQTLSAGTEGYVTGVTTSQTGGSGTITVPAAFQGSANTGAGLDTTLRTMAKSTGTAQAAHVTLTNNVAISSLTPAATDYSDTITVVGAGMF